MTDDKGRAWTPWECALAAVYGLLCIAVGFFAFVEIYFTVTHLVHQWMGDWAWIVPASAEGMFTGLYTGWLLLDLRDTPPRAVTWMLGGLLAASTAGSYWLNIYAARGVVPDAIAHVIVVTAFYGVLLMAKILIRRLRVTPEQRALSVTLADAKAHARDMLRSGLGISWHLRAPVLLRRQLRSGRLPAKVMEAVADGARYGGATVWEPAVEAWVATAVTLPERTAEVLRAARAEASAPPPATPSRDPSEEVAGTPLEEVPATPVGSTAETTSGDPSRGASAKPRRLVPAKASDDELAALITPLLTEGEVSPTRVVKVIREHAGGKASIGHERAGKVLALAAEQACRVVSIGERRAHQ
jgi:hypothetical protein